ncbi:MAG: transglutaminase-like domain-containing protein [candidate division KSB1 bacterium]|nr:transglutaminase-like domain-containing protein [candidate division KSB1 bacterium]
MRAYSTGNVLLALSLSLCLHARAGEPTVRYRIRMLGEDIGSASYQTKVIADSFVTRSSIAFRLKQAGQAVEVTLRGALASHKVSLLPLYYHLTVYAQQQEQATIEVAFRRDSAFAVIRAAGLGEKKIALGLEKGTFLLDNNFCLDHYQLLLWHFHQLHVDSARYPFLVPQILVQYPQTFHLRMAKAGQDTVSLPGGKAVTCHKLEAITDSGLRMSFWVRPEDGFLLRWAVPAQYAEALYDSSWTPSQPQGSLDLDRLYSHLIDRLYIRTYTDVGDWKRLEFLRIQAKFEILALGEPTEDTPWQDFEGQCKVVDKRACYDGVFAVRMVRNRHPGRWLRAEEQEAYAAWLQPEIQAPSDHPEIRALADSLRNGATHPLEAVQRVCAWIHSHIRYEITGSDALTCLRTRRGDCGPQSYLAVALLRALGIPARLAGGLLYVGGRFGQHNWVEAYLGEEPGWVPVDPTTGEVNTFSAAHLTLWRGWAGALNPDAQEAAIDVLEFRKVQERGEQ